MSASAHTINHLTVSMSAAGDALDSYTMPYASSGIDVNMFEEELCYSSVPTYDVSAASRHSDSRSMPAGDAQPADGYAVDHDSELIHDGDRERPLVPQSHTQVFSLPVAIPPHTTQSSISNSQDARLPLNTSAASALLRFTRPGPRNNETIVSTNSVSHHDLNNSYSQNRPVFESSQALAAHYGIPQVLPPAPRLTSQTNTRTDQSPFNFAAIRENYLSMLKSGSTSDHTSMTADSTLPSTVSPADLLAPVQSSAEHAAADLFDLLASPDMFTSPMAPSLVDFESPTDDSPLTEFLQTPLIDDLESDMFLDGTPLFEPTWAFPELPASPKQPEPTTLYTMSPISPSMDAVNNSVFPSPQVTDASEPPSSLGKRRRNNATGTRRGLTVDALVPLDAPTQGRRYVIPSATSKKELPAMIQRKRARIQTPMDEEEDAQPPPSASEQQLIEWKRRQNTLAARKSRLRKLEHQQKLEMEVEELKQERDMWRVRTEMLMHTLQTHNIPTPDLSKLK